MHQIEPGSTSMGRLVKLASIAVLCAALWVAQRAAGQATPTNGGVVTGVPPEKQTTDLFNVLLDLSDAQQQKLREILDSAIQQARPLREKIYAREDSLFQAVKSGKNDEEIAKVAAEQANLSSQMQLLEAATFAKIYRTLNNQQQSKVDVFFYDQIVALLENGPRTVAPSNPPAQTKP